MRGRTRYCTRGLCQHPLAHMRLRGLRQERRFGQHQQCGVRDRATIQLPIVDVADAEPLLVEEPVHAVESLTERVQVLETAGEQHRVAAVVHQRQRSCPDLGRVDRLVAGEVRDAIHAHLGAGRRRPPHEVPDLFGAALAE